MSTKIAVEGLSKDFPSPAGPVTAISGLDFQAEEGEFLCVVGPSGCGKSTLLRILAGLIPASTGKWEIIPGEDTGKPLSNLVFQEYAIFPWKTVINNIVFGLEMRRVPRKQRYEIATQWLERVGLGGFADHYPHQLSGGMKQRVGIARALANDPEVLLMDEPLGALDAQTRTLLQEELLRIWQTYRKTVLYVTHSIEESVLLGDRVILMTAQPGTTKAVFDVGIPRPRDLSVTSTREFASMCYAIWESLRDEVMAALEARS